MVSYYVVMNLSLMDDQRVLQASGLAVLLCRYMFELG